MKWSACFLQTLRECFTNWACSPFFLLALLFYSFYYCLPYAPQLPVHLNAAIVDEDDSPLSRRLVQALQSTQQLNIIMSTQDRPAAVAAMREEKIVAIITIPANFEQDATTGVPTAVSLVSDGAFVVKGRMTISGATGPLEEIASEAVAEQLLRFGYPADLLMASSRKAPRMIIQPMYNNISGYLNFVAPIVFIVIIQTLMGCGAGMLLTSWYHLPVRPPVLREILNSPQKLLAAQAPVFLIALIWCLIVEGPIFALHGINSFQNIPATLCLSVLFALAVSAFGIFAGVALGPGHFVIQAMVLTSLPCVFISGNLWPWQNIPIYMRVLAYMLPSTPGSSGMLRASQCGAATGETLPYLIHLLALAIIYMLAAMALAKWRAKNLPAPEINLKLP